MQCKGETLQIDSVLSNDGIERRQEEGIATANLGHLKDRRSEESFLFSSKTKKSVKICRFNEFYFESRGPPELQITIDSNRL